MTVLIRNFFFQVPHVLVATTDNIITPLFLSCVYLCFCDCVSVYLGSCILSSASSDSGQAGAPSGAQLDHIHQTSSTDLSAALSYNFQIKSCESYQAAFDAVNPICPKGGGAQRLVGVGVPNLGNSLTGDELPLPPNPPNHPVIGHVQIVRRGR